MSLLATYEATPAAAPLMKHVIWNWITGASSQDQPYKHLQVPTWTSGIVQGLSFGHRPSARQLDCMFTIDWTDPILWRSEDH